MSLLVRGMTLVIAVGGCAETPRHVEVPPTPEQLAADDAAAVASADYNEAAAADDAAKVASLIERGMPVDADGCTKWKSPEEQRANPKGRRIQPVDCRIPTSALELAAAAGALETVNLLLEHHADPNRSGGQVLLDAAKGGHVDVVETLLEHHADPKLQGWAGDTPLIAAAWTGNLEAVRVLVAHGADVNQIVTTGPFESGVYAHSALAAAAVNGGLKTDHPNANAILNLLLENGAVVDIGDKSETPLVLAVSAHQPPEVIETLCGHGARTFNVGWLSDDYAASIPILAAHGWHQPTDIEFHSAGTGATGAGVARPTTGPGQSCTTVTTHSYDKSRGGSEQDTYHSECH